MNAKQPTPDVCLVLEGTYPFVQGGVSSWVHNLIRGLPETSFTLLHLGASPLDRYDMKYSLPSNVVGLQQLFVQGSVDLASTRRRKASGHDWPSIGTIPVRPDPTQPVAAYLEALFEVLARDEEHRIGQQDPLATSGWSWDLLTRLYERLAPHLSFTDFYWTWRYTHLPLFNLMRARVPAARVYHTLTTGYAGWLAAWAARRNARPLLLTEHGIYTRERAIEIAQSQWIYEPQPVFPFLVQDTQTFFKQWWIDLFRYLSQVTYDSAARILTITGGNQAAQLRDGADLSRMELIANAINPDLYAPLRRDRTSPGDTFTVGFVGRVVRIKDVKTFIRAMNVVAASVPNLRVLVVGSTEEEADYVDECRRLVEMLGLNQVLTFVGQANVREIYPQLDVVVLTSLSEGQPLVLLEANCAGVPAVASNVGACEELLYGRTPEDRALGPSGIVTPVASPNDTAQAVLTIWRRPELRRQMAEAGMRRVETFYRETDLLERYRAIYAELAER